LPGRNAGKHLRLTFSDKQHPCPIHDAIEETKQIYQNLLHEYGETKDSTTQHYLKIRIQLCLLKLETYKEHMDKFAAQRPAQQALERKLKDHPGVCEIQEDYCADYEIDGFKMINLIIVCVYWDAKTKKVEHLFLDHYSRGSVKLADIDDDDIRGSADRFLQKAVWVRLLQVYKDFFKKFHTIYKSNDNGASIKNSATFYFAGRMRDLYGIRVVWLFLCPFHACNRCDQHGGTTKKVIKAKQRKIGKALDTAQAHAAAINERKIPNTGPALAVDAIQEYDEDLPRGLCTKKDLPHQVYGLRGICVAYFEIPNPFDTQRHATTTIAITGVGLVASNSATDEVAFHETRPEAKEAEKRCDPCTLRYGRIVLTSEHDQTRYYLCRVTQTYTLETMQSLDTYCVHCHKMRRNHLQGKKENCPSMNAEWVNQKEGYHNKVRLRTIDGFKDFKIIYCKPPFATDLTPLKMDSKATYSVADLSRLLIPKQTTIYKQPIGSLGFPWGLGLCVDIDFTAKTYLLKTYTMELGKVRNHFLENLSPLGKWKLTDNTITVKWDSPLLYPIRMVHREIPLWRLQQITQIKDFEWNNIASLVATSISRMELTQASEVML